MTAVPLKILVVDDDQFAQKLIIRALQNSYELKTALDGDQGIKLAIEWQPSEATSRLTVRFLCAGPPPQKHRP